ncbi:MAG: DUF5666 domain-containing protein [Acidobacteriaceae bacterium]|nr:DUF5666 domain-containing protein [Acidobacteriaceae bacterium]
MQMEILKKSISRSVAMGVVLTLAGAAGSVAQAQSAPATAATAPTTASSSQRGTVKAVAGNALTIATDAGLAVTVNVATEAKILQLPVGSTSLKDATTIQLSNIAVGDRVLVTGRAGDAAGSFNATRVILMKSSDIAQMQAAQQADWKARGVGGIVSSVDPASGAISLTVGAKKLIVNTSSKTVFRRSAGDSVKYEDTKLGTFSQIQPKDQVQARGTKSADGSSMEAEEVVSGSFENLSGLLLSVDTTTGTITLKDLATKKVVTVHVTPKSDIRSLPLQMATRVAARTTGSGSSSGATGSDGARRSAGADLSQMIAHLPAGSLSDLKSGDAVMVVASGASSGTGSMTGITLLTGVEPILTANPNGGMSLSMNVSAGSGGE